MKTLPMTEVKSRFSELADDLQNTHEHLTVTRNGRPALVILAAEDWESIEETMFWTSIPGLAEDLDRARTEPTYPMSEVQRWIDAGRPDPDTFDWKPNP